MVETGQHTPDCINVNNNTYSATVNQLTDCQTLLLHYLALYFNTVFYYCTYCCQLVYSINVRITSYETCYSHLVGKLTSSSCNFPSDYN